MPLINCKVELKLRWTKHSVLASAGVENDGIDPNNIIFTIKDIKLHVPVITLSAKDNQKLSNILSKGFERAVYWNEYKTKSENKNTTNGYRHFLESNFAGVNRWFVLVYLNRNNAVKRFKTWIHYLPKGTIKNYYFIINGNNFHDQPIDSDTKWHEKIRKLTTDQGKD